MRDNLRLRNEDIYRDLRVSVRPLQIAAPSHLRTGRLIDVGQENCMELNRSTVSLTDSQAAAYADAMLNYRALIEGDVGVGKSVLAWEITREYRRRSYNPIHLVPDEARRHVAFHQLRHSGAGDVRVMTLGELPEREDTSAMVIDDADYFDAEPDHMLARINEALAGGIANGRWTMFAQDTQDIAPYRRNWIAEVMGNHATFADAYLDQYVRGTHEIATWISESFNGSCYGRYWIHGPEVRVRKAGSDNHARSMVEQAVASFRRAPHVGTTVQAIEISGNGGGDHSVFQLNDIAERLDIECLRMESANVVLLLTSAPIGAAMEDVEQEIARLARLACNALVVVIADPRYYQVIG